MSDINRIEPYSDMPEDDTPDEHALLDRTLAKRRVLIWLLAIPAILPFIHLIDAETGQYADLVSMVLELGLMATWVSLDSRERGRRSGPVLWVAVVLFAAIAIPVYLFMSRGFKQGALAVGRAILFFLLMIFIVVAITLMLGLPG